MVVLGLISDGFCRRLSILIFVHWPLCSIKKSGLLHYSVLWRCCCKDQLSYRLCVRVATTVQGPTHSESRRSCSKMLENLCFLFVSTTGHSCYPNKMANLPSECLFHFFRQRTLILICLGRILDDKFSNHCPSN